MNKIIGILVIVIIAMAGALVYTNMNQNDGNSSDPSDAASESTQSDSGARNVDATISNSIIVNNPEWGHVQVQQGSYTGRTVTYEAVPAEGCSFVAWLDSKSTYIETSNTIVSSKLDPKGTVAAFTDEASGNNRLVTYSWQMPLFTYDSNGKMEYQGMEYPCMVTEADYDAYHTSDVHRKAVLGNVYLTPWELVADDPAVKDIVDYLKPYTDGLTNMKKAWVVMAFVQDIIAYQTDSAQYGQSEYWAYPIETVYSGKGDCEDTAILFCAVGSKLGLDTGLVSFSYTDTERRSLGHMGAAVALVGTESVTADNDPTFTYKGQRYCYVETACDSRFDLGYLLKYPDINAYLIQDGGFTHILYDESTGFDHEVLVAIGANYDTSALPVYGFDVDDEVYYGDDFTNPPTINMAVGDSFSYIPQTNMACKFSASGSGLKENGGPFEFDAQTNELKGKVTSEGTYQVVIKAETVEGPYQVAYQYILFQIGTSDVPDYGGMVKSLTFTDGSWNVVSKEYSAPASEVSGSDDGIEIRYIIIGGIVAAIGIIMLIARFR